MLSSATLEAKHIPYTVVSGRQPVLLSDPRELWLVESGAVDVFLVRWNGNELVGGWHPLMRIDGPGLLSGIDVRSVTDSWMLIGVMTPDSKVIRLVRGDWAVDASDHSFCSEFAGLIENWLAAFSNALRLDAPPKTSTRIDVGATVQLAPGEVLSTARNVVWLRHLSGKSLLFGREEDGTVEGDLPFPLAETAWLECREEASVEAHDTVSCLSDSLLWDGLAAFGRMGLQTAIANCVEQEAQERVRFASRQRIDDEVMEEAVEKLAAVLSTNAKRPHAGIEGDPLLAACRLIGEAMGVEVRSPPDGAGRGSRDPIETIAKASRLNRREVGLRDDWWRRDNGPMLAFMQEDGRPVALIPLGAKRYELHDPTRRSVRVVNATVAAEIQPFVYTFYRPFKETVVGAKEIMRLGTFGNKGDIGMVFAMGIISGLLGMVVPIATGILFDTVIPSADKNQLLQLTIGLVVVALASALFQYTRGVALLRVEGKMDASIQAAVWDRLLTLPVPFFRDYTAGDLASRANGINAIRQTLSGTTVTSILGSIFSLFNFGLLFYYSTHLALVATGLVFVMLVVIFVASYRGLQYERGITAVNGRLSGMVLQLLSGVAKLKVTGSEPRAFAVWAKEFSNQRTLSFKARTIGNFLATFNTMFPVLGSLVIFLVLVYFSKASHLSTGQFIAFTAAYGSFSSAMVGMAGALLSVLRILPLYERAKPILTTPPEIDETKADPGELQGEIEANHVFFRYNEDTPMVMNDVSIRIRAGQFVALVGASGSGKSTLLRLLLGFETPTSGTIYYDGKDLAGIDVVGVRRQIGVVLQNGQLLQGDIFSNIVASSNATLEDAWEAARMCGLDKDIEELPMGMHTVISEGGGGLSGGQRQRLMVARAIVQKPRILFFDEATSALDNNTQAVVSQSLDRLEATRVVIAHRLSTIVNADYIYVMDKGLVVQQGTYQELLNQSGLFSELAKRQLV